MGQAPPFSAPPDLNEQKRKASKTTTWIVLGVIAFCGCGGLALMAAVLLPVFVQAKSSAIKTRSLSNIKFISTAVTIYTADNNDRFPPLDSWQEAVTPLITVPPSGSPSENPFQPPYTEKPGGYAFNASLEGVSTVEIPLPSSTVMIFESSTEGRNLQGGEEIIRREEDYFLAGFTDSSARIVKFENLDQVIWAPK